MRSRRVVPNLDLSARGCRAHIHIRALLLFNTRCNRLLRFFYFGPSQCARLLIPSFIHIRARCVSLTPLERGSRRAATAIDKVTCNYIERLSWSGKVTAAILARGLIHWLPNQQGRCVCVCVCVYRARAYRG